MGLTASPWTLSYPEPGDRPDHGAEDLWMIADRMDFLLTRWAADDERLRKRPMAKVSYDSTVRYKINSTGQSTVTYNTVQVDNAGMTDLQRRADRIYLPVDNRPGLYAVGGSIYGLADNLTFSQPDIRISSNAKWSTSGGIDYPFTTRDINWDRHETVYGETFSCSTLMHAYQAVDGGFNDELWVSLEINSGFNFTVWYADMFAFWVSDIGSIP